MSVTLMCVEEEVDYLFLPFLCSVNTMKFLLLTLLISLSANAQSIEVELKAKVLQLETDKIIKNGWTLTDAQFASFHYKLMPIKMKWNEFYEVLMRFRGQMRLLEDQTYPQLLRQDKLRGTHKADSLVATLIREEHEKNPKEAYLKEKYGNADPNRLIYEVSYVMKYKRSGQEVVGDKQVLDFYQNDLSVVHFLN